MNVVMIGQRLGSNLSLLCPWINYYSSQGSFSSSTKHSHQQHCYTLHLKCLCVFEISRSCPATWWEEDMSVLWMPRPLLTVMAKAKCSPRSDSATSWEPVP